MTTDLACIVRVTRRFAASAERVFDAWLDTALLRRWMFGPPLREEVVLRLTLEPRVGGSFSFLVRRLGREIDHVGEYREIDRPRRLVFTWGIAGEGGGSDDDSLVTIDIAPLGTGVGGVEGGGGCELTLVHRLDPKWDKSRAEAAWASELEVLGAVTGGGSRPASPGAAPKPTNTRHP